MTGSSLDNPQRLAALRRLGLLHRTNDETLDRLTYLATQILRSPVATVTVVTDEKQIFKSSVGLNDELAAKGETPLSHSFCKHVVMSGEELIVEDARTNALVCLNPAITDYGVVAYAGVPLVTNSGEPLGSFCVIDHEPRTWTDREVEILRELARAAETEINLRSLAQKLASEEQTRVEMTQFIVHDLRTPLTSLLSGLQTAKVSPEHTSEFVDMAIANGQRLMMMINDLLDIAKLEIGNISLRLELGDLTLAVESAVESVAALARELQITVETTTSENLPLVPMDKSYINRVLINLLGNALRFTDHGSMVLVKLSRKDDRSLICQIIDTGQGIAKELQGMIFERYGRVEGARRNLNTPSTGLGLTFCKLAIEAHGGEIGVDSQEGLGSTFWFTLPAAKPL